MFRKIRFPSKTSQQTSDVRPELIHEHLNMLELNVD